MDFYKKLAAIRQPIPEVLAREELFSNAPGDWHVVVADIINSTEAVASGRHADVNLIAAGCLIAVLNVTKSLNIEIPYFFGGDGGTVLVPSEMLEAAIAGLHAHKQNSLDNFSLNLRVGSISIKEIVAAGYEIKIAKVEESPGFNKSLLIGNGIKYAEYIIKKNAGTGNRLSSAEQDLLNMEGMECKWDKIRPPASELEVVCFLIEAIDEKKQATLYCDILKRLDKEYGDIQKRHPITINMLKFKIDFNKLRKEMIARYSKWKPFYFLKESLRSIAGKFFFKYNLRVNNLRANDYLNQLITFSEILTIDGRINTIVSGNSDNRKRFVSYLQELEKQNLIVFGHYVSTASIMTCYVQNMENKHVHFIDGADGGYTEAAKELKPKLAALRVFE